MNKVKKEFNFTKKIDCSDSIQISLNSEELKNQIIEFIWFFNGTNNIRFLIENNNLDYVNILYKKYLDEIDKLIKYYDLKDFIEDTEFFHGWFKNWKNLETFTEEDFFKKLSNDLEFCSIWGDFAITDSVEFRNWGLKISFDSEDRGTVSQQGKDQFKELINSLMINPENGNHIINYFNILNNDERLLKTNLISNKFFCETLSYKERIDWFFSNFYETGMEYEVVFESFKKENLDYLRFHDKIISIPKYNLNIISDYCLIEGEKQLDNKIVFNYLFIFYVCKLTNMIPKNIFINSIYRIKERKKKKEFLRYRAKFSKEKFESLNLELKDLELEKC